MSCWGCGLPCPLCRPLRTCGRAGDGAAPAGRDGTRRLRPRVPQTPQGPALPAAASLTQDGDVPCPGAARPGLLHPRRGAALRVPATPIPDGDRRSPPWGAPSPTGAARPIPSQDARRGARPGVPDGGDSVPAATEREDPAAVPAAAAGAHAVLVPRMSRGEGSGEKPHGTLAGGMSLRGDAPGRRYGWRPVRALFIYFFTHRVINLCMPGRKARGGGGPCEAVQPASPSSGPPRKSPEADPSEMLSLPIALLRQKAVGQRVQNHGRDGAAMPFYEAEPVRQGRAGWALPGQWGQDTPPDTPRESSSCTSKAFIAQIRARLKVSNGGSLQCGEMNLGA